MAAGIATGYGLDGPGIESRWGGEIFRIGVERPSFPPRLLYCGYREFLGVKRQERGAEHPLLAPRLRIPLPPLCASIDGISWGDLYLYTLYEPLWRNWIATRLCAVRSGVRIALGVKIFVFCFQNVETGCGAQQALWSLAPGGKAAGVRN